MDRRPRPRDLGLTIGLLPSGPSNAITDVADVTVGHATVWRDEPPPPAGRGVSRTGVTAVIPFDLASLHAAPVPAGVAVLNGAGELTGSISIAEWGLLETPILLTGTMAVGRVFDGAVALIVEAEPGVADDVVLPVVGECDDSSLSYAGVVQIGFEDVAAAVGSANGGDVQEGAVGAGTGMVCFGWKGGIGTASRLAGPWTVGVLTLCNFGVAERLTVAGVPVGRHILPPEPAADDTGSCIVVVATDAPLLTHQLTRLARRAGLGLARTGSFASHGSGEIFVAFSTGLRFKRRSAEPLVDLRIVADRALADLFAGVVEATEEAVLNALFAADTVTGHRGRTFVGLPVERVVSLVN